MDGDVFVKLHHPRTDADLLARRLSASSADPFVRPLSQEVLIAPDGRPVTVWPRVSVASPATPTQPWAEAGALLATLHAAPPPAGLPQHGWVDRLHRAIGRAPADLAPLGRALLTEALGREEPAALIHGDWHVGQLGFAGSSWKLLDIDDLGVGDPAWDFARPAGFWAVGLLGDDDWHAFLAGAGRPSLWDPAWDLPARCAVFVAAVRAVGQAAAEAEALVEGCRRMS
ncbi:MAG: aminoglycoside phosphotransferase family protein [Micropruina sp.]|nr:aminoglycoside phosphotransferase family protein [Micropruina sp.]